MTMETTRLALPYSDEGQSWPVQDHWTCEDYLRLPDDGRRYEIIDGLLYVANARSFDHQITSKRLITRLVQFVDSRGLGVILYASFEVHLPGIAKPAQPDILFISAERQPKPGTEIYDGAPDLIVEVLSPNSLRLDQHVKFGAYELAGVREYWLADPKTRSILVYTLPEGSQEYALLGQFTAGDTLRSEVLAGLELPVGELFVEEA